MSFIAGIFFLYIYLYLMETLSSNKQISYVRIKKGDKGYSFKIHDNNDDFYNDNLWMYLNNCKCLAHYAPAVDVNRVRFACDDAKGNMISVYLDKRFNTSYNTGLGTTFCSLVYSKIWIE